MVFPAHLLLPQPGLIEAAGGGAVQVFSHHGIEAEHGEGLLGQQNMGAALPADLPQDFQVPAKPGNVRHIGGCMYFIELHDHSTSSGFSSTCQGSPQRFSASI